jgi:hypothetical protein
MVLGRTLLVPAAERLLFPVMSPVSVILSGNAAAIVLTRLIVLLNHELSFPAFIHSWQISLIALQSASLRFGHMVIAGACRIIKCCHILYLCQWRLSNQIEYCQFRQP